MKESNAGVHLVEKTPLHRDESAEKAVISLDVAGYTPDQLKIEVDNHVLTISGSRTNALGDTFVIRRRLALQHDVYDEDNVTANLENTVLRVSISKKPAPTSRKIPITLVSSSRPSTGHSDNDDAKSSLSNQTDEKNEEVVSVETVEDNEDEQDNDDAAALASSPHTSNDEQSNKHSDDAWEQVVNA